MRTLLVIVFLICLPSPLLSAERNYIRRVFRASDGLRETQVTSVSVSPRGTVWARHGDIGVLSYLDGYHIRHIAAPPGNYRIYESKSGQIWSLYAEGLQEYNGEKWINYPISEIHQEFLSDPMRRIRQIPLLPTKRGEVFFLVSKGLMVFDVEKKSVTALVIVDQTRLEKFIDMIPSNDDGIWITGKKGILKISPDILKNGTIAYKEFLFDEDLNVENGLRPVEDEMGGITLVADSLVTGKRVSLFFDGKKWHKILSLDESIRQSWRDIDQTFWGLTINRLINFRNFPDYYIGRDVLNLGQMFEISFAKGGIFYAATIDGLYRFAPALWIQESVLDTVNTPVHSINQTHDNKLWFITSDGLGLFFRSKWTMYNFEEGMEQIFQPQGSPYLISSDLMVLNVGDSAHFFNPKSEEFIPIEHPSGRYSKLVGQLKDGSICLLTMYPGQTESGYRIDLFDGKRFRHFMEATNTVRLGSDLFFVKQVSNGDIWVGGATALAVFKNKQWFFFGQDSISIPTGATCMAEIETNKLWFGLQNNIYEYDGKYWRIIKGNIGNVRTIFKSSSGTIWVATANGLFKYEKGKWISNGSQEGLPSSSIYTVFEDKSGKLWTGTSRGIATFNPDADTSPPIVRINSPKDNSTISTEDAVPINFTAMDKWKYTTSDRLYYSWRLSGSDWSEYSEENSTVIKGLNSGTYQLFVKAMDRNMNESPIFTMVEFSVIVPWYKDNRTISIAILGISIAVIFAGIAVIKHFQLKRSYAEVEKIVNQRTKELENATQQLLLSQKMTALGTLAAGIAHDFNNILSIIKGSAQIIEDNLDNKEKILLRVQRIKTSVDQAAGIVRAMLGFSRENGNNVSVLDVNMVVDETIKLLGDRFLREVLLHFTPASPLPLIRGIRELLQQILLNLILNAADAIQSTKGYIEITTGVFKELPSPLVLTPESAEEYIFITVKDTGCGIEDEKLSRIFEPFFTTKNLSSKRGTGLGLTTVYQYAQQLNYGIYVKSFPGFGSVFTIIIPVKNIGPTSDNVDSKKQEE